jgi:Fe-S-cluster containining protein
VTWYKDGLKFQCTQCGNCCTGAPGYVWIRIEDIYRISEFLGIKDHEFARQYVRKVHQGMSLIELANGNCVFYEKGCKIYPVRPQQCRTFPFWKEIMDKPANWQKTSEECPGMNQGEHFREEEIEALLREQSR